jgi:hypothetical protein
MGKQNAGQAIVPPKSSPAGDIPPLVVSEEKAAGIVNLSLRTLQGFRLSGEGGPPYVQLSTRRVGYKVADLRAWLESRTVASTSAATVSRRGA